MVFPNLASARRPALLALALLAVSLSVLAAQEPTEISLQTFASVESSKSGTLFLIRGAADLPDHTRLLCVLWYAGQPIYRSWRRTEVVGGRFSIKIGPIHESVLAGTYEAVVQFSQSDQPAQLRRALKKHAEKAVARTPVYVGTAELEAEEEALYREFLPTMTRNLEAAHKEVTRMHDAGMVAEARASRAELVEWAERVDAQIDGLRTALREHDETRVFASRYPETIRQVSVLVSLLELLFHSYAQDLFQRHGVTEGLPDLLRAEPVFRIVPSEVRREIERRFGELAEPDRTPGSVTIFDLYQDLLQLNELRLQVGRSYQAHRLELSADQWEGWHASWLLRLRNARANATRYANGKLSAKIAIEEELECLVDDLERLGWIQFNLLYQAHEMPLPEGAQRLNEDPVTLDEKIRTRWRALFEVVQEERKRLQERLRDCFGKATAEAPAIAENRARLEKGKLDLAAWAEEAKRSNGRLEELRTALDRLRAEPLLERFFPATAGGIRTYLDCLARILIEVEAVSNGGPDRSRHAERLGYLDRVLREMHDRVEKDLNRKDDLIQ